MTSTIRHRTLQEETGENFTFDSPTQEAVLSLFRTSSLIEAALNRVFRPFGLSGATYNILRVVERSGKTGRCCGDIGRGLITAVPDVTRLVDRLEKLQYVIRERSPEDRRMVHVVITDSGKKVIRELRPQLAAAQDELLGDVSASDLKQLTKLLGRVREALPA